MGFYYFTYVLTYLIVKISAIMSNFIKKVGIDFFITIKSTYVTGKNKVWSIGYYF